MLKEGRGKWKKTSNPTVEFPSLYELSNIQIQKSWEKKSKIQKNREGKSTLKMEGGGKEIKEMPEYTPLTYFQVHL